MLAETSWCEGGSVPGGRAIGDWRDIVSGGGWDVGGLGNPKLDSGHACACADLSSASRSLPYGKGMIMFLSREGCSLPNPAMDRILLSHNCSITTIRSIVCLWFMKNILKFLRTIISLRFSYNLYVLFLLLFHSFKSITFIELLGKFGYTLSN